MLKKRVVIAMISIAVISFLIGTTLNVVTSASNVGNPFDKIWEAIYDLQDRVTSLEESTNSHDKTWHFVASFTLSFDEEPLSPLFSVQGQKWRVTWDPKEIETWGGFLIWDENGYGIEWVQVYAFLADHPDAKGIHYVPQGEESHYIECLYGPTVDFTIESYH